MVSRWRDGRVAAVDHDPGIVAELEPMAAEVAELLDRVELTQALEAVWVRIRRLNRYVEETAPWNLAKDVAQVDRLDQVLATLIEGVRSVSVALHCFIPDSTTKLLTALGRPDLGWEAAAFAARGAGGQVEPIEPLFPKP